MFRKSLSDFYKSLELLWIHPCRERQKTQQTVLDSMFDPCSVEGMATIMAIKEPHRSACFAHLQKLRAELNNQPILPASTDSFPEYQGYCCQEIETDRTTGKG